MKDIGSVVINNRSVKAFQLETGDQLEEGDYYYSTSGEFSPCPCPGIVLQEGFAAIWIRPDWKRRE